MNPWDSFQQGMMTGRQLGMDLRQRRDAREIGGMLQSGDFSGAASTAFQQGDLQTGLALQGHASQQAGQERQGQIVGALRSGDFQGAAGFAQTPEELAQIETFKRTASEQEIAQATQQAERLAMVATAIASLPPEQQLQAARQYAQQFGMDPNQITPEMLTPDSLEAFRMRALGLKEYLEFKQDERDAQRPIIGNGFISLPPGSSIPPGFGGAPEVLDALPQGARIRPRPNQAPSAPAAGGAERNQTPRVSFRSSGEARSTVQQIVPGVTVTNADRTPADTARLRRQGYKPSNTSFHLQGRALDLTPPAGMSMAELAAKMRQAGFRVLNEGHHVHVSW